MTDDELIKALKTISMYCSEHIAPEGDGDDCDGCPIRDDLFKILKENLPVVNDKDKDNDNDIINHPGHYETGKYECFDVMHEALGDEAVKYFCICNAFKYIYRHRRKNGKEDICKAIWYLEKWQALQEGSDGEQR